MSTLSFTLSKQLIHTLAELDDTFKKTHASLLTYPERTRLALHRYAKKGMLGWSANFTDVLPKAEIKAAAQFAPLQAQMQDLLAADKRHGTQHDEQMIAGYLRILDRIYQDEFTRLPLSETIIKNLHADLVHNIPNILKGQYKKQSNAIKIIRKQEIGDEIRLSQSAPPGPETEKAMQDLILWYNDVRLSVPWTVALACEFLFRFFRVHPFQDGNGRVGRSLFLLILRQSPHAYIANVAPYLGIYRHMERDREGLVSTLGEQYHADPRQYQMEPLCHFMASVLKQSLEDIPKYKHKLDVAVQEQMKLMMAQNK